MEYLAVYGKHANDLTEKVNNALKKGYKLQGGISSFKDTVGYDSYSQALYKETSGGGKASGGAKRKTRHNRKTLRNRK
jgi:hypothetical protein